MEMELIFESFLGTKPYKHQLEAGKFILEKKPVIVRAPCGSGKTEACYIPFLMGKEKGLPSRLVYSLPTRALVEDIAERIREGIKKIDIASQIKVSCHHGASTEDPFFRKDIIVTTIDQTVGAYCCVPLSLPVHLGNIPAGAVVASMLCFDEVHTYDYALGLQTMLALIERIMDSRLNLPFVVMSATLPDSFLKWFREKGVHVIEAKEEDIPKRKNRRVILHWVGKVLEPKDVLEKINEYNRIIVVCNTVNKAQTIYSEILKNVKIPVFLLHSRFLEKDRKRNLENMKKVFRKGVSCCLVSTQVCEVGIDISCDIMLTELAPPEALIQRIGRCAREGHSGEVYVFDVEVSAPYEKEIMERTRNYVRDKLNGKIIKWNEELKLVNSVLNKKVANLIGNETKRRHLLKSLGDAAFEGKKEGVEKTVREILNANVTIHDAPEKLSYNEMRNMPWISLDIRVFKKFINDFNPIVWEIEFYDNEKELRFKANRLLDKEVYPHGWYVVHPSSADYDAEIGLKLGCAGQKMKPIIRIVQNESKKPSYQKEAWVEHAVKCLKEFSSVEKNEKHAIELLSRVWRYDFEKTRASIAFCVALHDIGKLNREWQKAAGAEKEPLAHTNCFISDLPPHAVIAGYALQKIVNELAPSIEFGLALRLAMAHHHHTRAEHVPKYEFIPNWRQYVSEVLKMLEKYGVTADINNVNPCLEDETMLPTKFPNIENLPMYTAYSIVSRIIRLCDWRSLGGW